MKPLTLFIRTKSFLFFTIILFTSISLVNASNACPVFTNKTAGTNQNGSVQVDKYLIEIISSPGGGYGYNIYQEKNFAFINPLFRQCRVTTALQQKPKQKKWQGKVERNLRKENHRQL